MEVGRIEGATRVMGREQDEFLNLPIRDDFILLGPRLAVPCMTSAWLPTPDEIERISQGAPIYVRLLGTSHPPIALYIGNPPDETEDATRTP